MGSISGRIRSTVYTVKKIEMKWCLLLGIVASVMGARSTTIPDHDTTTTAEPIAAKLQLAEGEEERNKFQKEILDRHNKLRAKHQAPPLVLDSKMSKEAQKRADQVVGLKTKRYGSATLGENFLHGREIFELKYGLARSAVNIWYDTYMYFKGPIVLSFYNDTLGPLNPHIS